MKEQKCLHKGCKNKHKSVSGYCVDHVAEHSGRRRVYVPQYERAVTNPHLAEEDTRGFHIPKVI